MDESNHFSLIYDKQTNVHYKMYDFRLWLMVQLISLGEGDVEMVRETYERAVANVPLSKDNHFWRRYIYLWINYSVYEELETQDIQRTIEVMERHEQ